MPREADAKRLVIIQAIDNMAEDAKVSLSKTPDELVEAMYSWLQEGPINMNLTLELPTGKDLV